VTTLLIAAAAFASGAVVAWLFMWGRTAALSERQRSGESEVARLNADLGAERAARALLAAAEARLGAELSAVRAGAEARVADLVAAHERLKAEFTALSADALRTNREDFLKLAEQSFAQLQQKSDGDLAMRQQAIDTLVKPLRESLEKVDVKIGELEQRRERAYGELGQQLATLSTAQLRMHEETSKISSALSTTRTAGTWGEVQLRRVVELAGMIEHCDFDVQLSVSGEDGALRPDMVVHLPGGQQIVVDSKAPTEAYREAAAETDPARRLAKLREHAAKVRGHVERLADKEYWAMFTPTPEYVVLFMPGDSFLAAALEADPSIMDRAIDRRVLLATPMTLVALLKAAAYGWRQDAVDQSAAEVSKLGRELYDRIATFADHLGNSGRSLAAAVSNFNKAVGSFEQQLLPGARKFTELGARGTKELGGPERIDVEVREVSKRG
jgi:DNA recombination protein RmuC